MTHAQAGRDIAAVRRAVDDGGAHPGVVEHGGDVVHHLVDGDRFGRQVGTRVVVPRHSDAAVFDHDDVEPGVRRAASQPLVDLQRRHAGTAGNDDQRMRGLAAGAHVVKIELLGVARGYRPADRPDTRHFGEPLLHPAPSRVYCHRRLFCLARGRSAARRWVPLRSSSYTLRSMRCAPLTPS